MGHSVGILLIAAAAGFLVLTLANKEKGRVKNFGQLLGLLIIVVSVALTACKLYYCMASCSPSAGKACPFMAGKSAASGQLR